MNSQFWSKVNKRGPRAGRLGRCWVWMGARNRAGYGAYIIDGQIIAVHRVAWGDVPTGMLVLPHCDNPPCVRRSHLFLGTQADNMRDAVAKGRLAGWAGNGRKTHCPAGHAYSHIGADGFRKCRLCFAAATRRWRERRRVA